MQSPQWDNVISSKKGLLDFNIKELWKYKDLIYLFIKRDFVAVYKQTVLGPLWYIIQPILTTFIYTVVFGRLAGLSTDGIPPILFYLSGTVMWQYFATCLTKTSKTFIDNAGIFGKVYFPRLILPISTIGSTFITFTIQFGLFLIVWAWFYLDGAPIAIQPQIVFLPLLILIMALLSLGIGIIISSLTTKYRDLNFLVVFGVQLFMYATPVIYPLSMIPERFQFLARINPMSAVIEGLRFVFMGKGSFQLEWIIYSFSFSVIIFFAGVLLFNRIEKDFMDTV